MQTDHLVALTASPELRLIYDTAPIGLAFLTPDCRYLLINQHLTEVCGVSVEGHIGRTVRETVPKVAEQVERLVQTILETGVPVTGVEINGQRPDGSNTDRVWITYWHPLKNQKGDVLGINVAAEEITERKRAEAALSASEERLRKLNETLAERVEAQSQERDRIWNVSQDLLAVIDRDGTVLNVNPAWLVTLGWNSGEVITRSFEQFIHPEDVQRSQAALRGLIEDGQTRHFESRGLCNDGTTRWLAWHAVFDRGCIYAVGRDITNIREAQQELNKLQRTLAHVSRMDTIGAMTASIAHEIRQPLAVIVANANAGTRWLNRTEPNLQEVQDALAAIAKEGHRIDEVISSIRAMFGKDDRDAGPVDVRALIADILALVQAELRSHNVALREDLPDELPLARGERVQLQQVLLNLVMNAIEAMNAVTDRERQLTISASVKASKEIEVVVEDTGCGIDPANADRIFDTFFTTKGRGMGVGLAICRSIAEAHGGRIWALPRENFGTAFHLTVPIQAV
ncbi:MAG TPA: PAS domain-containing protein [Xanthobacteraceae bacterium]|jgi:PAS domain S-box-containing protein|nr:PAS domain-containing protein [Xanthobacteraceae bacterium]